MKPESPIVKGPPGPPTPCRSHEASVARPELFLADLDPQRFDHAVVFFRRLTLGREVVADKDRVGRVEAQRLEGAQMEFPSGGHPQRAQQDLNAQFAVAAACLGEIPARDAKRAFRCVLLATRGRLLFELAIDHYGGVQGLAHKRMLALTASAALMYGMSLSWSRVIENWSMV